MAILYGAQGTNATTSDLYTINSGTGAATSIGPIGFALTGLAFDPTDGTLYGITSNNSAANPHSLITVDPVTGTGTLIGDLGLGGASMRDLAITSDGTIWGVDSFSENLYTVNKITGAATLAASLGLFVAFDPFNDDSFCSSDRATTSGQVWHFQQDGTFTVVHTVVTNAGGFFGAASFGPDGKFYAVDTATTGTRKLFTVAMTGVVTTIGNTLSKIDALAWDTQARPAPPAATGPRNDDYPQTQNSPFYTVYTGPLVGGTPQYYLGNKAGGCSPAATTLNATAQVGEPDPYPGFPANHSVWFTWDATRTATFRFWVTSTDPNMADGVMSIYNWVSGVVSGLGAPIGQGDNELGGQPQVDVALTDGNSYAIQVDCRDVTGGVFTLNWVELSASPPANDSFASAGLMVGDTVSTSGTTVDATAECDEPREYALSNTIGGLQGPFNSVWYKWIAPRSGLTHLQTTVSSGFVYTDLFSGTTLTGLTPIDNYLASTAGSTTFTAVSGTTYYFRVEGSYGESGQKAFTLVLGMTCATAPANDDFSNATIFSVDSVGTVNEDICGASLQMEEITLPWRTTLNPANDTMSIWWTFTIDDDGEFDCGRVGLPEPTGFNIRLLKGTTLQNQTFVASFTGALGNPTGVLIGAGTYYVRAGATDWNNNVQFTWQVKKVKRITSGTITKSALGDYQTFDVWPNAGFGFGGPVAADAPWIRMVLRRVSGTYVHHYGESDELKILRFRSTSGADLGGVSLYGKVNGRNHLGTANTTSSNTTSVTLGDITDDDAVLIEVSQSGIYLDGIYTGFSSGLPLTSLRYVDIGMISGPPSLTGWSLEFDDIMITDDRRVAPIGAPGSNCKDLEYFTGWSDGVLHDSSGSSTRMDVYNAGGAIAAPGTYNTPAVQSPVGSYPTGGKIIDCSLSSLGTSGLKIPYNDTQHIYGATFRFMFTAWPDVEMTLAAFKTIRSGFVIYSPAAIVTVDSTGVMRGTGSLDSNYFFNPYGIGIPITQLNLNQWYTCQTAIDTVDINKDSFTPRFWIGVDGGATSLTLNSDYRAYELDVGALPYPNGNGGSHIGRAASSVGLKIGAVAIGRGYRSWPMDGPFISKVETNGIGDHNIPALDPPDLITTFDCDRQLYYGGDDQTSLIVWDGQWGIFNGAFAGDAFGNNLSVSSVSDSNTPSCIDLSGDSALLLIPTASTTGLLDHSKHDWPHGLTPYFDSWIRGTAGQSAGFQPFGDGSGGYIGAQSITFDGTYQHWRQMDPNNYLSSEPPPPQFWATFGLTFSGAPVYMKNFRLIFDVKHLPVHAVSPDAGATGTLIDTGDSTSYLALKDSSDNTMVVLDNQYVFDWVARSGENLDLGSGPFFQEVAPYGRSSNLEYTLEIAPNNVHGARLLARTCGYGVSTIPPYQAFSAARTRGIARFGVAQGGVGRKLGQVEATNITPGEVLMAAPADPGSSWPTWDQTRLRMGFMDESDDLFPHYGLSSTGAGGMVSRAFFEVCSIEGGIYGPVGFFVEGSPKTVRPVRA